MNVQRISGLLIFASFLITIISYIVDGKLSIFAGIFGWIALILLIRKASNIKLLVVLIFLSLSIFSYSLLNNFDVDFKRAILANQYLLTLLIGVGFLRLIATPKYEKVKQLPKGQNSLIKTYWGVHLFGSVINISSLVLVADKLYKKGKFTKEQTIVLTRAFSSDAFWSPFFVAFAAASTYAPKLSTITILMAGLTISIVAFIITFIDVKKNYDIDQFCGYPIQFETLLLPFLLASLVLTTNHLYPNFKVIVLISFFSIILTIFILPIKIGIKKSIEQINNHINVDLPKMKNEISLFLIAGMFGVSVSTVLMGYNIQFPFEHFDAFSGSIILLVIILLSFLGIHPIISIAVIGNWTMGLNHTFLAAVFLMSWGISVATSPFSGINLTMQARYDANAVEIFKLNLSYGIKMYIFCVIILFVLANYLGL